MRVSAALLATLAAASAAVADPAPLHHAIRVTLDPSAHRLAVEDTLTWKEGKEPSLAELKKRFPGAEIEKKEHRAIVARYAGKIRDRVEHDGEEYARGFATTTGTIEPEGVFLGQDASWYPAAGDDRLLTFTLDVTVPAGWDAMSQGRRTLHERSETETRVRFEVDDPQEEIWLVAGPWTETLRPTRNVEAIAMLRTPDDALAAKYLDATAPNVAMYTDLLGPHAYGKFALVENFWDTGYGMPSFTLLGPQVIRLPFIPTTSYPHEILHDWWGNGVYADRSKGNWCEGLTAYLADHMVSEQRGTGASYRQETLQKYVDHVARSKDFALASFHERHSAATEAVGYGKALMVFHMIRRDIGDEAFTKALRAFYAEWKFRRASWTDLRRAFEKASGKSLETWLDAWVQRTGAPTIKLGDVKAAPSGGAWRVTGTLRQTQPQEAFPVSIPVAITMDGRPEARQETVRCAAKQCPFSFEVPAQPLRIDVDPEFDLFRTLDSQETPPALSTAFGADGGVVVLPSTASPKLIDAYRAMIASWSKEDAKPFRIVTDDETASLPADAPVWVLGWENRLAPEVRKLVEPYGAKLEPAEATLPGERIARAGHAVALVARRADDPRLPLAFVAADTAAQVPGLARKLPHYGKYSYLAFEGDEPANTAKGRWPIVGSPLSLTLDPTRAAAQASLALRPPLAQLPPSFSEERMMAMVRALSAPAANGRGLGTSELDAAADTIASVMKGVGLEPAGEAHSFFQRWEENGAPLKNVVGMLRGTKKEWENEATVVSAHYDHLGPGHPGADDNASGVAVLLDLARALAASGSPQRTVIFAAFTGEESGLLGSKRFLATWPKDKTITSNVNLDTVGRMGEGGLAVLGTGSADEWVHIANGAGYVTGIAVKAVPSDPGGSDQRSFVEAGIPAVQLFTGAHADYHAATDTADKVDGPGLVKVASVAKELVAYLAERDRPLTARTGAAAPAAPAPATGRRASLGAIPDYAFSGPGVRITGAMPGSPAEAAGLKEGDVIVGMDGVELRTLAEFSAALGKRSPGDTVRVRVLRAGGEEVIEAILGAR